MRSEKKSRANFRQLILPVSVALVGALWLTTGCSSTTKRQLLTLFFDGVPPENAAVANRVATVTTNKGPATAVANSSKTPATKVSLNTVHKPFAEGKCSDCHGGTSAFQSVQSLQGSTKQLCFSCHKDFLATAKVKHPPVENGECLSCHQAHESPFKKLLVKKDGLLCFDCHDNFTGKFKHQPAENLECNSCHNPHVSEQKKLLVKADGKLCFDCHDDFESQLKKAKFKHQPVDNGECSSCHNPHASDVKKLLVKADGKLCFDCHDDLQSDLAKAPFKHDPAGSGDCGSCHNPHQSNFDKLLLKDQRQICMDCHDEKDMAAVKGHAGQSQKSCTECHDPHLGKDKYLLKIVTAASKAK